MASVDSPYTYSTPSAAKPHHTRSEHKRQQAEHSKRDSESSKRDTELYLQYYTSSVADGRPDEAEQAPSKSAPVIRRTSHTSTSSSDYSDSQIDNISTAEPRARRRSAAPSNGGSDRRRLAIVQVDPLHDPSPGKSSNGRSQSGSLRNRRAVPASLDGLALVAPPDAAPRSYSHLTPPTTSSPTPDALPDATRGGNGHTKSSTRGLDADPNATTTDSVPSASGTPTRSHIFIKDEGSGISDSAHGLLSPLPNSPSGTQSLIVTPEIGEEKEIGTPVAAPVVINLSSAGPFRRKDSSKQAVIAAAPASAQPFLQEKNYLNYQPGVHATAGPLPPPPRAVFNIDTSSPAPPRPPRLNSPHSTRPRGDIEAVKHALQLPSSVTAVLASKSSSTKHNESPGNITTVGQEGSGTNTGSASDTALHHVKLGHKREGAFPPSASTSTASDSEVSQLSTKSVVSLHEDARTTNATTGQSTSDPDVPPITVVDAMTPIDEQKEYPGTSDTHDADAMSTPSARRRSDEGSSEKDSPSRSPPSNRQTPSPPPKSFRNSLTTNFKRLSSSLPRTPSLSSKSRRSSSTVYSPRTPSPSIHMAQPPPVRSKIISQYPPAMFYAEITARKTSVERCALYAQKINELYTYDSGLGEWTIETKLRNNKASTGSVSSHIFTPQPRHTSRASMLSEATFPRRPDASTATDLSVKTHDLHHSTPPTLPYPSLMNQRTQPSRTSSVASGTPPSSLRSLAPSTPTSKSSGGFFASLGRKASMTSARKEKTGPSPSVTNPQPARLVKSPPANLATPRAINITNTPSVPGGPRAVPNRRAMRSQTILTTTSPFASNAASPERNEELTRRPSLADLNVDIVIDISADPEFARQVDKLADLLPNANRSVLAGYLRRAGQDILAIGQYLEDEKNGTIKAP